MEYVHEVIEVLLPAGMESRNRCVSAQMLAPFGADLLVFSDCVLGVE